MLRRLDAPGRLSAFSDKRDNFCDFLFTLLSAVSIYIGSTL